jgi:hypothetical protein
VAKGYLGNDRNGKPGNLLAPCFIRDHHDVMRSLVAKDEPDPENKPAEEALMDMDYKEGLIKFGRKFQERSAKVWEDHYIRNNDTRLPWQT